MIFRLSTAATLVLLAQATLLCQAQQMPDIDSVQFNFGGININAKLAQTNCPDDWFATVNCVATECPEFMEVCPTVEIPEENVGTAGMSD